MDWVRFGRLIRALRKRRGWRQVDLAVAARVSQSVIARIELGQGDRVVARTLERVAQALGARLRVLLDWNGESLDRLIDSAHAGLVDAAATRFRAAAWEVAAEVTFWIRGERGSVDLLAWHATSRILLIVEIKSVVPDMQAMLMAIDRKVRLGREIAASRGWQPVAVGRLLVIGASRTARRRVEEHCTTFEAEFPHRFLAVRAYLAAPIAGAPLRGLIFVPASREVTTRHRQPRVRRPA